MNNSRRSFAVSLICVLLTGCMVGPNYKKPVAPVPPAFTGAPASGANDSGQNVELGHYLTIWQIDRSGDWKIILDLQKKSPSPEEK